MDLFLSASRKGWKKSFGFPDAELYAKSLKKKIKKTSRSCLAENREIFWITSKGKIFRADRKKVLLLLITGEVVTISLFR